MKRKNITIDEEQEEYIQENAINLSKLVRQTLEKKMRGVSNGNR